MVQPDSLTRGDLSVLLRIVGSRKGADFDSILAFETSHHRQKPTPEQIRDSISRLTDGKLIEQRGNLYFGTQQVQSAFMDECRNCTDTIEEFDVLNRIIAKFGLTSDDAVAQGTAPKSRWR